MPKKKIRRKKSLVGSTPEVYSISLLNFYFYFLKHPFLEAKTNKKHHP